MPAAAQPMAVFKLNMAHAVKQVGSILLLAASARQLAPFWVFPQAVSTKCAGVREGSSHPVLVLLPV